MGLHRWKPLLLDTVLVNPILLGNGVFGSVTKAQLGSATVCVKSFKTKPDNDVVIAPYLYSREQQSRFSNTVTSGQMGFYAKKVILVGSFVAYDAAGKSAN